MTDPIKTYGKKLIETVSKSKIGSKLKFVGKAAKVLGWVVGVDVTVTSVREFNNKDSRAYGSVGKSLIHAGVAQLKSAGPIEGALIGAKAGPRSCRFCGRHYKYCLGYCVTRYKKCFTLEYRMY